MNRSIAPMAAALKNRSNDAGKNRLGYQGLRHLKNLGLIYVAVEVCLNSLSDDAKNFVIRPFQPNHVSFDLVGRFVGGGTRKKTSLLRPTLKRMRCSAPDKSLMAFRSAEMFLCLRAKQTNLYQHRLYKRGSPCCLQRI